MWFTERYSNVLTAMSGLASGSIQEKTNKHPSCMCLIGFKNAFVRGGFIFTLKYRTLYNGSLLTGRSFRQSSCESSLVSHLG